MPENYNQGEEIIVGNRRLRKVKRPKQHATPISVENQQAGFIPQQAQNTGFYAQSSSSYGAGGSQEYRQNEQAYAPQAQMYDNPPSQYTSSEPQFSQPETQTTQNVPQFYEPQMNNPNSYPMEQNYVQEDAYAYDDNQEIPPMSSSYLYGYIEKKKALWGGMIVLFAGILIGALFFGGKDQVVQNGLQGVVVNPEVPKGRARCGVAEKMQGCVLYVMNPQRQELNGRDFYDLASQLTGRQRFVIETGNMRYSSVKIRPGAIAQLNIPPLQ